MEYLLKERLIKKTKKRSFNIIVLYDSILWKLYKKNTEKRKREKDTDNGIFGKRKTTKRDQKNVDLTLH